VVKGSLKSPSPVLKNFPAFLFIGLSFSAVGEFLTCFFIKLDTGAFFGAMMLYSVMLVLAFLAHVQVDHVIRSRAAADLVYFFLVGSAGLMSEWALGNSPWMNPRACQFSMFLYHVTTYFMPRLFLDRREWVTVIKKAILWYFIPYFTGVLVIALMLPQSSRLFWLIILTFYMGYNFLSVFYLWYCAGNFRESWKKTGAEGLCASPCHGEKSMVKQEDEPWK
jgi:hypothetical protein